MTKSPRKPIARIPLENEDKGVSIEKPSKPEKVAPDMKLSMPRKKLPVIAIIAAVGVVIVGIAVVRYLAIVRELNSLKSNPAKVVEMTKEEQTKLVDEVGKIIALPEGETPTVATVSDVEKLRSQPFFAHAQNGDKVIIFTQAKKAILYRPTEHKVIEVAPITFEATASGTATTNIAGEPLPTPTPATYTVVLRNGTTITGLTRTYESKLANDEPSLNVTDRENAARSDYEQTIIVDVSGDKETVVNDIADTLGISVGKLPEGEVAPQTDFLIVLGKDAQ